MRLSLVSMPLLALLHLIALPPAARGQNAPPAPLPVLEPIPASSSGEIEQQLNKLKAQSDALANDLQKVPRRGITVAPSFDQEDQRLQARLQAELTRLRQRRINRTAAPPIEVKPTPPEEAPVPEKKTPAETKAPPPAGDLSKDVLDPLHLGHALFQVGEHKDALASFRMVDLKGRKAEERAPIQYLMAACLERLGQHDEAVALYREAGNSRGDPSVAGYAQWQIDMLRWQRETLQKLNEIRQRRAALEKTP